MRHDLFGQGLDTATKILTIIRSSALLNIFAVIN